MSESTSTRVVWSLWRRNSAAQRGGDVLAKLKHTLVEAWTAILEVDEEAVAAGLDVLREPLNYPFRRPRDRVTATLVAPDLWLGSERHTDA